MISVQQQCESPWTARARRATYVILALATVRFWLMPLGSSFWQDEAGTFWTVQGSFGTMLSRAAQWTNTPPLFGIISWAALRVGGPHEWALRMPALASMIISTLLVWSLARRLFSVDAALPAAAAFLSLGPVVWAATQARPYAPLLAFSVAATLFLVRWFDKGRGAYAIAYAIAASLTLYMQIVSFPLLLAHAVYALLRLREGTPVRVKQIAGVVALMGVLMTPAALDAVKLSHRARSLNFLGRPYLADLAAAMAPPALSMGLLLGVAAAWLICKAPSGGRLSATAPVETSPSPLLFALLLLMVPDCLVFAISLVTPIKIFTDRYILEAGIGLALLAGWAIERLQPALARWLAVSFVLIYSLLTYGALGQMWPLHNQQDWRSAIAAVRQVETRTGAPILFQSPFVESWSLLPDRAADPPAWLFAPLAMYPLGAPITPLPEHVTSQENAWIERTVVLRLEQQGRFIMVGPNRDYIGWMSARLPSWRETEVGNFGSGLHVVFFERIPHSATEN